MGEYTYVLELYYIIFIFLKIDVYLLCISVKCIDYCSLLLQLQCNFQVFLSQPYIVVSLSVSCLLTDIYSYCQLL